MKKFGTWSIRIRIRIFPRIYKSLNDVYGFYAAYISELFDDDELNLMDTAAANIEPCRNVSCRVQGWRWSAKFVIESSSVQASNLKGLSENWLMRSLRTRLFAQALR